MPFRRATEDDRPHLDEMTLDGARYWGHDKNFPEAYAGLVSLVESDESPADHLVYVLEADGEIVAFYDLRDRGDHVELLRMFIRTDRIGRGYGRQLWDHAVTEGARLHDRMLILSDPGAVGFYAAMGAELEKEVEVAPGFVLGVFWYDLAK